MLTLSRLPADAPHRELAARRGADLSSLWREHDHRNSRLAKALADADAGVLQMRFEAKAVVKRRLTRRLTRHALNGSTVQPNVIESRVALPFQWLTYTTVLAELLARDSGAALVEWTLLEKP